MAAINQLKEQVKGQQSGLQDDNKQNLVSAACFDNIQKVTELTNIKSDAIEADAVIKKEAVVTSPPDSVSSVASFNRKIDMDQPGCKYTDHNNNNKVHRKIIESDRNAQHDASPTRPAPYAIKTGSTPPDSSHVISSSFVTNSELLSKSKITKLL